MACSLLKLVFDVPASFVVLLEEDEALAISPEAEAEWVSYPRCHSHCK